MTRILAIARPTSTLTRLKLLDQLVRLVLQSILELLYLLSDSHDVIHDFRDLLELL